MSAPILDTFDTATGVATHAVLIGGQPVVQLTYTYATKSVSAPDRPTTLIFPDAGSFAAAVDSTWAWLDHIASVFPDAGTVPITELAEYKVKWTNNKKHIFGNIGNRQIDIEWNRNTGIVTDQPRPAYDVGYTAYRMSNALIGSVVVITEAP